MKVCSACGLPNAIENERCVYCGSTKFVTQVPSRGGRATAPTHANREDGTAGAAHEPDHARASSPVVEADAHVPPRPITAAEPLKRDAVVSTEIALGAHGGRPNDESSQAKGPPKVNQHIPHAEAAGVSSSTPTSDGRPMFRRVIDSIEGHSGFRLAVMVLGIGLAVFGIVVTVVLYNSVANWVCRKWYGKPSVNHIEISATRIRPGDNVRLTPITDVPCGGNAHPDWKTTHGMISPEGPPYTLSTQGVREQVPFNIYVSLVIEDKCENKSDEYRAPAPIIVDGPPRPKVTDVEPDSNWASKEEPMILTASADQSDLTYEWHIPGADYDGDKDKAIVKFRMPNTLNSLGLIPVSGSCIAITRQGDRSEPFEFTRWFFQKYQVLRSRARRGISKSGTKQILIRQGVAPPAGANINQSPAQGPSSTGGGGDTTTPKSPPAPAGKPSP